MELQARAETRSMWLGFAQTGNFLAEQLRKSTGYPLKVSGEIVFSAAANGCILLTDKKCQHQSWHGRL